MKSLDSMTGTSAPEAYSSGSGSTTAEAHLLALEDRLKELSADASPIERANLQLEIGRALVELERGEEAWAIGRPAFDVFASAEHWAQAAETCDLLFLADQDGSLSALGQGIWLAVTFPIDPAITLSLLHHVIDDTPDDSDGAAVAAATAVYLADLRGVDKERDNLLFFANQMLGNVARRHSQVESQEDFQRWLERLELDNPEHILPRLRNVVDVLVQDDWWIDREQLYKTLPVN